MWCLLRAKCAASLVRSNFSILAAVLLTRSNETLIFDGGPFAALSHGSFRLASESPLPSGVAASDVRFLTAVAWLDLGFFAVAATDDGVDIFGNGALERHISLPLGAGKVTESVSVHVTGMASYVAPSSPLEMLYLRSIQGAEKESFFITVSCTSFDYTVTPAYFVSRPYSVFVAPGGSTIWVQQYEQNAWLLEQVHAGQLFLLFRDFNQSYVWLDQLGPSFFQSTGDRVSAVSEHGFGAYSATAQRSRVYVRVSPYSIGSIAVKTLPVASSSVFYFAAEVLVHVVVTSEPTQLLLQCAFFSTNGTTTERAMMRNGGGNCVVTGCSGYQCCVQQPDTFLISAKTRACLATRVSRTTQAFDLAHYFGELFLSEGKSQLLPCLDSDVTPQFAQ